MVKITDPISDFAARIKNAYRAENQTVAMPYSKLKEAVGKALVETGYATTCKRAENELVLTLKYSGKTAALTDITRVSRPGRRVYSSIKNLPRVLGGLGIHILSTPKGVMSQKAAYKLNVGGEVLLKVW